jgi:hypothetical protein
VNTTIASAAHITQRSYLAVLFDDFEKHGGMRPIVMATAMDHEDPINDSDHYIQRMDQYLGYDELIRGVVKEDDLDPLISACLGLHAEYGHVVWIEGALLDYLRFVEGVPYADAVAKRDRIYNEAISKAGEITMRNMLENSG